MKKLLFAMSLMLWMGCGEDKAADETPNTPTPNTPEAPAPQAKTDHLGAWYGQGTEFPDGDLCLVYCDNGRLFTGDRPCTDTAAGDFQGYYSYTRTGDVLTAKDKTGKTVLTLSIRSLNGDTGTFIWEARDLPMSRTAATSALCTDTARTAY